MRCGLAVRGSLATLEMNPETSATACEIEFNCCAAVLVVCVKVLRVADRRHANTAGDAVFTKWSDRREAALKYNWLIAVSASSCSDLAHTSTALILPGLLQMLGTR